ncbi:MAG: sugar ABC transporter permease [Spirochaeta sp. LUC14_002_19_P3]|nr:MAG: sugar ABC transporter permease [Spirochaeta sp. LUC14_002_19_P3]
MFAKLLSRFSRWNARNTDISILPILIVAVLIIMTLATGGRFLNGGNIRNLAVQLPELGLLSMAMMVVMITAGINLAIISIANFSAVIMALILTRLLPENASQLTVIMLILAAVAAGLAVSALLGFINGILVGYIEVPAVLATLGTMILYEGITLAITKGFVISNLPKEFLVIGNASILGVPVPMYILVGMAVFLAILLKRRPFGIHLYAIGSNAEAARFSGINVRKVLVKAYVFSALLAGVAAVIMLARFNSANARQGSSLLLLTVLICMLGGVDPDGGFGKVPGLLLALVILQMVTSGLNLLGIRSFATVAIWGLLLLGALTYRYWQHKRQTAAGKIRMKKE